MPAGEPLLRGAAPCACRARRCASPSIGRWGVGGAPARVRFTVSGERRSWARRVARIFAEPSGALAARQKNRRARLGCWSVEAPPCRFLARLQQLRAAQPSCAAGSTPQKSAGLRTTTLHSVAWAAGGARGLCMRACVLVPGNAIFEHVFRSCGCHRAAAGLGRSSKACTACAL